MYSAFAVTRDGQRFLVNRPADGSDEKTITVVTNWLTLAKFFRLNRDDTAPFTNDFWRSFAYKMEIVDASGNAFTVDPHPQSPVYRAGRYRSDRYLAEVRLSPSLEGVRDSARIGKPQAISR